jgi:pyruvate/2-oxoglutarate/acetoin dehydrogenase E1 component
MRFVVSLNRALHQLMSEDKRVYLLGEDIFDPYGGAFKVTRGLSTAFPGRVITTPISEAGFTGIATGMALRGLRPVVEIMFGDFLTLCADQIINGACKFCWMYDNKVTVPLVIRAPMGARRGYGPTHSQTLETIFLNVPGLTILAPSCFHNAGQLIYDTVINSDAPVLFVEGKLLYPKHLRVPDESGRIDNFFAKTITNHSRIFPSISLSLAADETPEVTLIVYGVMAHLAAKAAFNLFMEHEINVEILIPCLIKPLPISDILPSVRRSRRVIIAEESVLYSGWGAELASRIQQAEFDSLIKPVYRIGAKDTPIPASRILEDQTLVQTEDIEEEIKSIIL